MAEPATVPLSKLPVSRPISVELLPSQTAPAATAPPPPKPPSSILGHPPYVEMIVSAIRALKERKGSSKKAIAKYIDSAYTNLPPSHSALLTHHLKRLKKSGVLLTVKNSYKLPKPSKLSGQALDGAPTKRGRGRPPKPKVSVPAGTGLPEKRGRGRPPKVPKPKQVSAAASSGSVLLKRGRGRPPKPKAAGVVVRQDGVAVPVVVPRPRGRPRKNASASHAGDGAGGELVLIPASGWSEAVIVPPVIVSLGRPRGRPPKVGGPSKPKRVPATGRPRGRPPKVGGPAKPKSVSSTGRPRGRPRKVPVAAAVAE